MVLYRHGMMKREIFSPFSVDRLHAWDILLIILLELQEVKRPSFSITQPFVIAPQFFPCFPYLQERAFAAPFILSPKADVKVDWGRPRHSIWLFYLRSTLKNTAFLSCFPISGIHS